MKIEIEFNLPEEEKCKSCKPTYYGIGIAENTLYIYRNGCRCEVAISNAQGI